MAEAAPQCPNLLSREEARHLQPNDLPLSSSSLSLPIDTELAAVAATLGGTDFARVDAAQLRSILTSPLLADWWSFAASWNGLEVDRFMADGAGYRSRRFAAFSVSPTHIERKPHQSHFQSRVFNPLNGGIERWFEPVTDKIGNHPIIQAMLVMCGKLFLAMEPHGAPASGWHAEMHQFRIGAEAMPVGKPTPEGVHRDGVDWVFVALINRQNICNGATRIFDLADEPLDAFTLERPLDAVFLNDRRVRHDVTPLIADNPAEIALRDVLVLTFRADAALPSRQKI